MPDGLVSLDKSSRGRKIYDNGETRIYEWRGGARLHRSMDDDEQSRCIGDDQIIGWRSRRRAMATTTRRSPTWCEQPAKVMRIGTMIKQLLEEVRAAPLDDASRNRLRDIHTHQHPRARGRAGARTARGARAPDAAVQRGRRARRMPSCGSPRPSWSDGSKDCSTASRPRCSPSRWRRAHSWSRCAKARCRPAPSRTARPGRGRGPVSTCEPSSAVHTRTSKPATRGWSSRSSTPNRGR